MPASSVSVTYPTMRAREATPLEVRIVQEEFKHDTAIVRVISTSKKPQYRAGTSVLIEWATGRDRATFTGFVHHVEQHDSGLEVWCKASSTRFDSGLQTVYRYRTATSVAGEIARQLNFDVDITGHGRVFDSLTATGGRTWEFLIANAKEIGYSLYAKNTRLVMHPRLQMTTRFGSQAPVFYAGDEGDRGSLFRFDPIDGAQVPGKFRHANVFTGTDSRTGRPFRVVGQPASGQLAKTQYGTSGLTYHNLNVSTPTEARWKAKALAELDRFNMTAKVLTDGNPRVHQTWPVLLAGDIDGQYIGKWFVHRVVHRLVPREYTMEMELGRDSHGTSGVIPDPRARRVVATRNAPGGKPKSAYPPSVLVNGQWRAQWSSGAR